MLGVEKTILLVGTLFFLLWGANLAVSGVLYLIDYYGLYASPSNVFLLTSQVVQVFFGLAFIAAGILLATRMRRRSWVRILPGPPPPRVG